MRDQYAWLQIRKSIFGQNWEQRNECEICIELTYCIIFRCVTDDNDQLNRLEAARLFILGAFEIACKAHAVPRAELAAMIKTAMDEAVPAGDGTRTPLPLTAPKLWSERTDLAENPVGFVRRVYSAFIGNGLTRPDLLRLDAKLYRALSVWENRHPQDRMTDIPTKSEVIDAKIAALSSHLPPEELRLLGAALQTRATRRSCRPSTTKARPA